MSLTLKSESKQIGELKVTSTQFPAMRSFALLARLLKAVGPTLGALAGGDDTSEDAATAAIAGALGRLDAREASELVPVILERTSVLVPDATGGREYSLAQASNIDVVFSGQLGALFQAIGLALQVNYRDFFSGSSAAMGAAPKAAPAA